MKNEATNGNNGNNASNGNKWEQMNQMFNATNTESNEVSSAVISNNKRKVSRPGLGDDLVPGKKARKFYNKLYGNNL